MNTVFVVKRNADFTEGRGPMVLHAIFASGPEAVEYVKTRKGIYGSAQKIEMGRDGKYASANGYDIVEIKVHDTKEEFLAQIEADERAAALRKLTARECELLGLEKE